MPCLLLCIQGPTLPSASCLPLQFTAALPVLLPAEGCLASSFCSVLRLGSCVCDSLPAERLQDQQLPVHLGAPFGGDTVCSAEGLDRAAATAPPAAGEHNIVSQSLPRTGPLPAGALGTVAMVP